MDLVQSETGGGEDLSENARNETARLNMTMIYACEEVEKPPFRRISGLRVFSVGEYRALGKLAIPDRYATAHFKWGCSPVEAEPLAEILLTDCLRLAQAGSDGSESEIYAGKDVVSKLQQSFAEKFVVPADPNAPFSLDWVEVLEWLDGELQGASGNLAGSFRRIRDFENLLRAAFDDGGGSRKHRVSREIWDIWNIEAFAELCLSNGELKGKRLQRFVDHFLDLKFKLYMLAEVDVPTYAEAKKMWGLNRDRPSDTPHGFATQLSEEVTLIVKSRAMWESIMNLVYWYVTGKEIPGVEAVDEDGVSYRSKQKRFFPWVAEQPLWTSMGSFEPLVSRLDQLRTSEVHRFSRVRSNFTRMTLEPLDQCVELINAVLMYVLDQFVAAIALRCSATYDVTSRTSVTLG
jgi:hypothetical protein